MVGDKSSNAKLGAWLAFMCLCLLGALPVISNSRPAGVDALGFAFFLSVWQLLFSLPIFGRELAVGRWGIFDLALPARQRRRTLLIILLTGGIFGLSTYVYVLAVEKAGAASAAVAMQAYPLFAILWESLFLKRRKNAAELAFTFLMLAALYHLATNGTWKIAGISPWFAMALIVPFLWSVAHVIIKEILANSPITPNQIVFFRAAVSSAVLAAAIVVLGDAGTLVVAVGNVDYQKVALLMGGVYYLELLGWFHAVKHIDVSVASSITVPAPAVTMAFAVFFLGDQITAHQVAAMAGVAIGVYGLLYAGAKKHRAA